MTWNGLIQLFIFVYNVFKQQRNLTFSNTSVPFSSKVYTSSTLHVNFLLFIWTHFGFLRTINSMFDNKKCTDAFTWYPWQRINRVLQGTITEMFKRNPFSGESFSICVIKRSRYLDPDVQISNFLFVE